MPVGAAAAELLPVEPVALAPAPDPDPVIAVDIPVIIPPTELVTVVEASAEMTTPLSPLPVAIEFPLSAAASELTIEV